MDTYKEYKPHQSSQTRRAPAHVWDEMRSRILELYLAEDHTLEEVAELMAKKHGFIANARQYRFKLDKWKISKNIPGQVMRHGARKIHENPHRHGFEYKHKELSLPDFERFQARHPEFDPTSSPTASTPSQMNWETASEMSLTPQTTTPCATDTHREKSIELVDGVQEVTQNLASPEHPRSIQDPLRASHQLAVRRHLGYPGVSTVYPYPTVFDREFLRLEWILELLLYDIKSAKTIEQSKTGRHEGVFALCEPTSKLEDYVIAFYNHPLERAKLWQRLTCQSFSELLDDMLRWAVSVQKSWQRQYGRRLASVWYCCQCRDGPLSVSLLRACIMCGHRWCEITCLFRDDASSLSPFHHWSDA